MLQEMEITERDCKLVAGVECIYEHRLHVTKVEADMAARYMMSLTGFDSALIAESFELADAELF